MFSKCSSTKHLNNREEVKTFFFSDMLKEDLVMAVAGLLIALSNHSTPTSCFCTLVLKPFHKSPVTYLHFKHPFFL